jgi:metallo-beta-lactamase family protein
VEEKECDEMCSYFNVVSSYSEYYRLDTDNKPKIVIAIGMLTGGRMLNYLEVNTKPKQHFTL